MKIISWAQFESWPWLAAVRRKVESSRVVMYVKLYYLQASFRNSRSLLEPSFGFGTAGNITDHHVR